MPTLENTTAALDPSAPSTTAPLVPATPGAPWLIDVQGVSRKYCRDLRRSLWYSLSDVFAALTLRRPAMETLREFEFWAIDGVSFQLRAGDALGLLGRNGAGKSTLIKLIAGQRSLSAGTISTRGRIVALTELGLGFNQTLTGRENAYINAAVHGFSRKQFDEIIEEIIDFSGIREFIDSAVQTYSTGMRARLGFSVATHLKPDILIVDEVLAVGDLDFRRKCVRHILKYIREGGSMMLVAHDPYLVQSICNRCIVLDKGRQVFEGSAVDGVNFHFQLGHSAQYLSLADAAERVLGNEIAEANAEAGAQPVRQLAPLTEEQPVAVDDIIVTPVEGDKLYTGRAARVTMHFRSSIEINISWGFTLLTADLQTSVVSCVKGLDDTPVHVLPGERKVEAILPDFPLQPGVYAVRGGIGDAESFSGMAIKGYKDKPHFFTVVAADVSRTANYKVLHKDLIACNVEWGQ